METSKSTSPTAHRIARATALGQAGMTLLEILIVLAIIALVMAFLFGPRLMEMFGQSKVELAKSMVRRMADESYARWTFDNPGKSCPADIAEVAKYGNDKEAKDPWGNQMIFLCGETMPQETGVQVGVLSMGPDGKRDTPDDVKSWDSGSGQKQNQ